MARADSAPTGAPGALDTGSLDEPQVRAMFDRIAGLYDRMNSVMTAGLHHAVSYTHLTLPTKA